MAASKSLLLLAALLLLTALHKTEAARDQGLISRHLTDQLGCEGKCASRCSNNWKHKMCMKMCNMCCGKCDGCVPDGPKASKDVCPCYNDLKNKKGGAKCP